MVLGVVLIAASVVLPVGIIVWAGGIWRDLPVLRRLDRGRHTRGRHHA